MTMREKMPRALVVHDGGPESAFDIWLAHADIVLDAMREPTKGMIEAGTA